MVRFTAQQQQKHSVFLFILDETPLGLAVVVIASNCHRLVWQLKLSPSSAFFFAGVCVTATASDAFLLSDTGVHTVNHTHIRFV